MSREGEVMVRAAHQMRQVAMVLANVACATAEIESMKAANRTAKEQGRADHYGEAAFLQVIERNAIHQNAVVMTLNQGG